MYSCNLCNKKFTFQSKLNEHKNRLTSCVKIKNIFKCDLCNIICKCNAEIERHKLTQKCKTNTFIAENTRSVINTSNIINIDYKSKYEDYKFKYEESQIEIKNLQFELSLSEYKLNKLKSTI